MVPKVELLAFKMFHRLEQEIGDHLRHTHAFLIRNGMNGSDQPGWQVDRTAVSFPLSGFLSLPLLACILFLA